MKQKLSKAFLIGPFIGELLWECLYFAPYAIYLKKFKPKVKLIVFTRPTRFDLYGQYADILVPLNLPNDNVKYQQGFGHSQINYISYEKLVKSLFNKYKKRFDIFRHIYPDIECFYYRVKWQFSRKDMDYDFHPRRQNRIFAKRYVGDKMIFVNSDFNEKSELVEPLERRGYSCVFMNTFTEDFLSLKEVNTSFLGCTIEILKKCELVISDFDSSIVNLALLLGIPVIVTGKIPSEDSISLVNPKKTMLINCENAIEGVDTYMRKELYK